MKKLINAKMLAAIVAGLLFLVPQLGIADETTYNCDAIKKRVLEASGISENSQYKEGVVRTSADEDYIRKSFLPAFKQVYGSHKIATSDPVYAEALRLFTDWELAFQDSNTQQFLFGQPKPELTKRLNAARKAKNDFEEKHSIAISKYMENPIEVVHVKNLKTLKTFLEGNRAAMALAKKMNAFDYDVIGESRLGEITQAVPKRTELDPVNFHRKMELYEIVYPQTQGTKSSKDNVSVSFFESDDVRDRQWSVLMYGASFSIKCNSNYVELYPEKCETHQLSAQPIFCAMYDKIKKPSISAGVLNGGPQRLPFESDTVAPLRRRVDPSDRPGAR